MGFDNWDVMPYLAGRATEWSEILRDRIMNDAIARVSFEEKMVSARLPYALG